MRIQRLIYLCILVLLFDCRKKEGVQFFSHDFPARLSEWGLLKPAAGGFTLAQRVLPYDLNSPLFSDYALKFRTVYVPEGQRAAYQTKGVLEFPEGTILSKTFFFPRKPGQNGTLSDFPSPGEYQIVETRLLVHTSEGWVGLPYIWNAEGTEAILEITGGAVHVRSNDFSGNPLEMDYSVPDQGKCSGCHITGQFDAKKMVPIGPKIRQLNRSYPYADKTESQLSRWAKAGILGELPGGDLPKNAAYQDPSSGTTDDRARAYLDANCAHCHSPAGPANQSGLWLDLDQTEPHRFGVCKAPTAAGKASAGLDFDIVPGRPDQSILLYRMKSVVPGERMPELARALVHREGVELVRAWIAGLKGTCER